MKTEMSPDAITLRLRRVDQLRRLCRVLGDAGAAARASPAPASRAAPTGPEPSAAAENGRGERDTQT